MSKNEARRESLRLLKFTKDVHAGLWIDKMLPRQNFKQDNNDTGKGEKSVHINSLGGISIPEGYFEAFKRWRDDHAQAGHTLAEAQVKGRMVVGIGQKGALEVGLTLHHTWGTPIIPGSTLKGITASTAAKGLGAKDWEMLQDSGPGYYEYLFGVLEQRGQVIFHDALWIPTGKTLPLAPDVMTVHHVGYYQMDDPDPPSDKDSPNPVAFVSVTGTFLIALEGEQEWCEAALDLLRIGADELGVGAKTNAGYGRLEITKPLDLRPMTPERWLDDTYGHLQGATPEELCKELQKIHKDGPETPGALDRDECVRLLRDLLQPASQYALQISSGQEEDSRVARLTQEIMEKDASKPSKKDDKALKRWKKESDALKRQLEAAQGDAKGDVRRQEEANQMLAWLNQGSASEA